MEEYTSDEGNYSSISSASGFSTFEDETDFQRTGAQLAAGSTDAEKHLLLQIDKCTTNIWSKRQPTKNEQHSALVEKINQELGEQNRKLERENKELLQQNETLQNEKGCRENCIFQLKQKITEQHENIHNLTQQNFKCNIDLSNLNNELTTINGMVDWYKTEWTKVNNERNVLQKDLFLTKNGLRNKKLEITRLEALLSDLTLKIKQNHNISHENHIKTEVLTSFKEEKTPIHETPNENFIKYYQSEINDLNQQLSAEKKSFMQQTEVLSGLIKVNSETVQKNIVLQRELDEKQKLFDFHEKNIENLKSINEDSVKTIHLKDMNIFELRTSLNTLNIQLETSGREKCLVQESINATRNNFHKLVAMQEELKDELKLKSKMVLTLERKLLDAFMYQNWNKCAIEEFSSKETTYFMKIKLLEEEISKLKSEITAKHTDSSKVRLELDEIKKYCKSVITTNSELSQKMEELSLEKSQVELSKSEEMKMLCSKFGLDCGVKCEINEVISSFDRYITSKCQSVVLDCEVKDERLRQQLELRCVDTAKKCSDVDILNVELSNEIQRLQDVLHLKEVELSNRQKRYHVHYRTLLMKIKQYKMAAETTQQENNQLKSQLLATVEELNTRKLELFQYELDKGTDNSRISKQTAVIHQLQDVIKQNEDTLSKKVSHYERLQQQHHEMCGIYEELNTNYEQLVSTHSKCLSTIETAKKLEKEQLDNKKIDNCTIVNTQHSLIERLEMEKANALRLISTLDQSNREQLAHVQSLLAENTFLQRLIIDMKSALNASAAKQHVNNTKPLMKTLSKYKCPILKDEMKIVNLCESFNNKKNSQDNLRDLHNSVIELKKEMSNMRTQLGDFNHV